MGGGRNRTSYKIARIMNSKADGVYGWLMPHRSWCYHRSDFAFACLEK